MLYSLEELATSGSATGVPVAWLRWDRRSKCVIGRAQESKTKTRGSSAIGKKLPSPRTSKGPR